METPKIVPQLKFSSLEDFINNNNNFWGYMILDGIRSRENDPFYQRFIKAAPELAAELRQTMTMDHYIKGITLPWEERLPWDKLWEAYNGALKRSSISLVRRGIPRRTELEIEFGPSECNEASHLSAVR